MPKYHTDVKRFDRKAGLFDGVFDQNAKCVAVCESPEMAERIAELLTQYETIEETAHG